MYKDCPTNETANNPIIRAPYLYIGITISISHIQGTAKLNYEAVYFDSSSF